MDEIFQGIPNVFGIADDILIAGFSDLGRDRDVMLDRVLRICRMANLKINRQMPFQMYQHSLLLGNQIMRWC